MQLFKNRFGYVRSGWLLLLACSVYFMMQILFSLPGAFLYRKAIVLHGGSNEIVFIDKDFPWIELLMNGGGVVGGVIGSLCLWKLVNKKKWLQLGLDVQTQTMRDFCFGLFLGAASMTVLFFLFLSAGYIEVKTSLMAPQFTVYSITYLILFLLVGFSEELFFRGYIMRTMSERSNPKWLIFFVSALIFSLFHGLNPNVSVLGLANIALVGILFAYMYDATNSLWLPIGYHITWNYFQGNVFGFPVSGTDPHGLYQLSLSSGGELFTGGGFGPEGGLLATVLILVGVVATNLYCIFLRK